MKKSPVLLDRVLQEIQEKLMAKFPWLDVAYGRAYKRTESIAERVQSYPAAYVGDGEYQSLLPNDTLTGFSWFDIYDPQRALKSRFTGLPSLEVEGALIFWYRLDKIFNDTSALYTEEIKNEVLRFLLNPGLITQGGTLEVREVVEGLPNIYKGYGTKEWDGAFFTYPYAGLRVELTLKVEELCD